MGAIRYENIGSRNDSSTDLDAVQGKYLIAPTDIAPGTDAKQPVAIAAIAIVHRKNAIVQYDHAIAELDTALSCKLDPGENIDTTSKGPKTVVAGQAKEPDVN